MTDTPDGPTADDHLHVNPATCKKREWGIHCPCWTKRVGPCCACGATAVVNPATDDLLARADNYIETAPAFPGRPPMSYTLISALAARVRAAEAERDAARRHRCRPYWENPDYQDWLNELMENAGDEWDDDVAMEEIALRYVRHLEAALRAAETERDAARAAFLDLIDRAIHSDDDGLCTWGCGAAEHHRDLIETLRPSGEQKSTKAIDRATRTTDG